MTIHHLRSLVSDDFEAVNALILDRIQSDISLIGDISHHILNSGGKRLRPLMVLLASQACGYKGQHHIHMAAMIEFFHTATLLHDDVIDNSNLRRGNETAHTIWGSKASILVGDYLLTLYVQLLLDVGSIEVMKLMTQIAHKMGQGEIRQLANRHNAFISETDYFEVIRAKTAYLFAASAGVTAILSDTNQAVKQGLYDFGLHFGCAFQLTDDALDYSSDAETMGKNRGDDFADGKATLPLLHAFKQGTPKQQQQIKESLQRGTLDYLPEILQAIQETDAIEYTLKIANEEADKAMTALRVLPDSVYKESLMSLAQYVTDRDR